MSFRLYVYYMAVGGAFAALLAWMITRAVFGTAGQTETWKLLLESSAKAAILGALVGGALGGLDALSASGGRVLTTVPNALANLILGCLAGAVGGFAGELLALTHPLLRIVGWVLTGTLIGTGLGLPGLAKLMLARQDLRGAVRKLRNGIVGGTAGGLLGGVALAVVSAVLSRILGEHADALSPSAFGWTVLGAMIGAAIGLAQVILRDAWVVVASGFRPGREILINKPRIAIGRAEGCDIGLFGDRNVEKHHAYILVEGAEYYIEDGNTPGGTFVNEKRVIGKQRLRSGDRIRVGECVLIFRTRARPWRLVAAVPQSVAT